MEKKRRRKNIIRKIDKSLSNTFVYVRMYMCLSIGETLYAQCSVLFPYYTHIMQRLEHCASYLYTFFFPGILDDYLVFLNIYTLTTRSYYFKSTFCHRAIIYCEIIIQL